MYYSETKVAMGGLAHVPILIFIINLVKGKFESLATKVVEVKTEEPKAKVVDVKTEEPKAKVVEVKEEEAQLGDLKASEVKEEAEWQGGEN